MATSLDATVKISASAKLTNPDLDIGTASYSIPGEIFQKRFLNGTSAGLANAVWSDERAIAASANDDLDLFGVLTDVFSGTLSFTTIKALVVHAMEANAHNLILGGDTTTSITTIFGAVADNITLPPGATICLLNPVNGYAITTATADKLRLTNAGGVSTINYEIIIIGTK